MTSFASTSTALELALLPHQARFVDELLESTGPRTVLLLSEPGLGKSVALIALAAAMLQLRPAARLLILVPAQLQSEFFSKLQRTGVPSLQLDRYRYREMLDAGKGGLIWPRGAVMVASLTFARQSDISESLADAHWDLVIVDEAHLALRYTEAIGRVSAHADKVVMATVPGMNIEGLFPRRIDRTVEWQRDRILGRDGIALASSLRPRLRLVDFCLDQPELSLLDTVRALARSIRSRAGEEGTIARSCLRRFASSPAALERGLQRVASSSSPTIHIRAASEAGEDEFPDNEPSNEEAGESLQLDVVLAARALEQLDTITGDSKLAALKELLHELRNSADSRWQICIVCNYQATLYYVAAEVEAVMGRCLLLSSATNADDFERWIKSALGEPVMAATLAALPDSPGLAETTDLVIYDLPSSRVLIQDLIGRFDRIGRRMPLQVHVLAARNGADEVTSRPLRELCELFSGSSRA